MKRNILVQIRARTCSRHLTENNYIKEKDIKKVPTVSSDIELITRDQHVIPRFV